MADEPAQAPDEVQDKPDAPEVQAPEQDKPAPEESVEHWRKQYEEIQPEFTRKSQQLSQYEQLIQAAQQGDPEALELLGLELDDEDEAEYKDEDEPLTKAEFQEIQQQQLQQQQEEQVWGEVEAHVAQLAKNSDLNLTKHQMAWLVEEAFDDDARSPERTEELFKEFAAELEERDKAMQERYLESKKAPQAPFGKAAAHVPDLDTPEARAEAINRWAQDSE